MVYLRFLFISIYKASPTIRKMYSGTYHANEITIHDTYTDSVTSSELKSHALKVKLSFKHFDFHIYPSNCNNTTA